MGSGHPYKDQGKIAELERMNRLVSFLELKHRSSSG